LPPVCIQVYIRTMKCHFLDLGTNKLQGVNQFIERYDMDSTWDIHTFDPNPGLVDFINEELNSSLKQYDITAYNVAVGESDDIVEFKATSYDDVAGGTRNWFVDESMEGCESKMVHQIDLARFIEEKEWVKPKDFVVCKMDVEGSEFFLLDHLIKTGAINTISDLYVEWHAGEEHHGSEGYEKHIWPVDFSEEDVEYYTELKRKVEQDLTQISVYTWF